MLSWAPRLPTIVASLGICTLLMMKLYPVQAVCAMYHNCEKECGAILFWQYMASIAGIPVWMMVFLRLMDQFDLV